MDGYRPLLSQKYTIKRHDKKGRKTFQKCQKIGFLPPEGRPPITKNILFLIFIFFIFFCLNVIYLFILFYYFFSSFLSCRFIVSFVMGGLAQDLRNSEKAKTVLLPDLRSALSAIYYLLLKSLL